MSGIDRDIIPDSRPSLVDRHLPNIPQVQRLLRREGRAHVFNIVKSTGEYHAIPRTSPRRTS
jgi:hypothetical protein